MEARLLLTFIVVSVLFEVCRAEFCYSYTRVVEGSRVKVPGFSCPKTIERPEDNHDVYCCGSSTNKYCCNDCRESQNGRACLSNSLYSSTVSVGAIIGITMGSTFVGLGCIYFGCCMFYTLFPRKAVGSRPGSFQQNSSIHSRKPSYEDRTIAPSRTKLLTINNGHLSSNGHHSIDKPAKVNGCPGSEPLLNSPRNEPEEGPGCEKSKVVIVIDSPSPSHSSSKETAIDFPATNSEASESRKASIESAV
ncbi:Hypp3206 [Branchiostoma lanceolatum]|uniref:Hypp3206 protein n=1 Tax=Branchiostoma lanceolatum TaxID=7740 RepID=A0A8K0EWU4_BRALA|nr:Hypp3206 [Branchiostoma lanceolatum]